MRFSKTILSWSFFFAFGKDLVSLHSYDTEISDLICLIVENCFIWTTCLIWCFHRDKNLELRKCVSLSTCWLSRFKWMMCINFWSPFLTHTFLGIIHLRISRSTWYCLTLSTYWINDCWTKLKINWNIFYRCHNAEGGTIISCVLLFHKTKDEMIFRIQLGKWELKFR